MKQIILCVFLDQNDVFNSFDKLVNDFKSTFDTKLNKVQDHHLLQRELLAKDRRGWSAIDHHRKVGDSNNSMKKISNRWMIKPALKALNRNVVAPAVLPSQADQLDVANVESATPRKDETTVELFHAEDGKDDVDQVDGEELDFQAPPFDNDDLSESDGALSPYPTPGRSGEDEGEDECQVMEQQKNHQQQLMEDEETPIEQFEFESEVTEL